MRSQVRPHRGIAVLPILFVLTLGLAIVPASGGTSFGVGQASHAATGTSSAEETPLPVVVRPTKLPHGPASKVAWLGGNVVHTARGHTVTMPWTRKAARNHLLRLVGHTANGWFVKSFGGGNTWTLWSVRNGKRHEVTSRSVSEGEVVDYRLSRNHQRFLVHVFDGDSTTSMSVRDLNNTQVDAQDFAGGGDVLAFSAKELIVNVRDTRRWEVDARSVEALGVDAAGADIGEDLLFVTDPVTGESGPTSLDNPGTPQWTAQMAQVAVSPRGGRVLSRDANGGDLLTVYNRATGAVRTSFAVRFLASEAPIWESNRSFVFVASTGLGDREALVRCRISGSCHRISKMRPRDTISLPPF